VQALAPEPLEPASPVPRTDQPRQELERDQWALEQELAPEPLAQAWPARRMDQPQLVRAREL
jgi:hypothetical protein